MNAPSNVDGIPDGFAYMQPFGPFHELVGPFYHAQRGDRSVIGLHMAEKHRNKGPMMHGGMLLMVLDTAMTQACVRVCPAGKHVVTTSLSSELLAPAQAGMWIEAEVEVLRAGHRVIFLNCLIRDGGPGGPLLVRGSGTFQVITPRFS